jgi:ATP-dependent DNA ligase
VKNAHIDGEFCGVDEGGYRASPLTRAATDDERGAHLAHYAFDLLHLDGQNVSDLQLIERKAILEPEIVRALFPDGFRCSCALICGFRLIRYPTRGTGASCFKV